jgi:hypothetical protein
MVYLVMSLTAISCIAPNGRTTVNSEFYGMCKEMGVAYFKAVF